MQHVKTGLISLLVTALLVFAGACRAEKVVIDHESPIGFWFVDGERFLDRTGSLTAAEIAKLQDRFKSSEDLETGAGDSGKYWGRFTVQNNRTTQVELLLVMQSQRVCTLHVTDNMDHIVSSHTGGRFGLNQFARMALHEGAVNQAQSRYTTFSVPALNTVRVLTDCEYSDDSASVSIFEFAAYVEAMRLLVYLEGLLVGATLFMAAIAIFSALINRDQIMFWYALWLIVMVGVILSQSTEGSRLEEFLFADPLESILGFRTAQYLFGLSGVLFLVFCYRSLDLPINLSQHHLAQRLVLRGIRIGLGIAVLMLCSPLFAATMRLAFDVLGLSVDEAKGWSERIWNAVQPEGFISQAGNWVFVPDLILRLIVLLVAIWIYARGQKSSRYIVAALVLYFMAFPGLVLARPLIPDLGPLILHSWHFALTIEVAYCLIGLTMAFAVTVRNKEIKEALDEQVATRQAFMEEQNQVLEQRVKERTHELMLQTEKTERLMLNILPAQIAERLKKGEPGISDSHASVSILFSDLVGFTSLSSKRSADEVVKLLNDLFSRFDIRAKSLGLEKIKTIGDAYMVAGGIPQADERHAALVTEMALGMREDLQAFNTQNGTDIAMRIGINSGSVIAGVIGHTKFSYDLWGNTVNAASRMESTCEVGQIQVSASTHELIKDLFTTRERGFVDCKGLGQVRTHFVIARAGE